MPTLIIKAIQEEQTLPLRKIQNIEAIQEEQTLPLRKIQKEIATPPLQERTPQGLGWLPALSLTCAIGVLLVALAYEAGRLTFPWADSLFWVGLLVLFLPVAWRILSSAPARRERILLLLLLGSALYFVKVLQYPLYFVSYDEFSHWRTAYDIATSGDLFQNNPLLPISAFYPGLEIIVSALVHLTGFSFFTVGVVVIGVGRIVLVLALYLFSEYISSSARVAGIATLLYIANPDFLFFDAQFAYESLAIPLAIFVLFVVAFRSRASVGRHSSLTLMIYLGLGAVVITHHITSYALVAFLLLWTAISIYLRRYQKKYAGPGEVALVGLALAIAWTAYTGDIVLGYLIPHFAGTIAQVVQILTHQRAPRQLFHGNAGFVPPLWERVMTYASVALIVLGQPFGLLHIWRSHRTSAVSLVLAGAALAYPVSQALRFTQDGAETGVRATEFLFLGLAFVLAIGITKFWLSGVSNWRRSAMILSAVAIILVGQVIAGEGTDWVRIPGPYLVSADERSIEPEGIAAAEWARAYLGPGQRMGSDRVNTLLMATYGDEQAFTSVSANVPLEPIFTSSEFGPDEVALLRQDKLQYLVVDRRLSTGLPLAGGYFNDDQVQVSKPIDPAALAKFDNVKNISRLFDSGDIIIYNVEAITDAVPSNSPPKNSFMPTLTYQPLMQREPYYPLALFALYPYPAQCTAYSTSWSD